MSNTKTQAEASYALEPSGKRRGHRRGKPSGYFSSTSFSYSYCLTFKRAIREEEAVLLVVAR